MKKTPPPTKKSADIIPFSPAPPNRSRRGRPRLPSRQQRDYGTPELILKRQLGQTSESLDLCLERGLISEQQHWCGVHLRWLFTLRHGSPSVRALDPVHIGSVTPRLDDPAWRKEREQEYKEAISALSMSGSITVVKGICIYNERPHFLHTTAHTSERTLRNNAVTLEYLRSGLDILVKLWKTQ